MVFVTIDPHSRHDAGICGALLTKAHERGERRDLSADARRGLRAVLDRWVADMVEL